MKEEIEKWLNAKKPSFRKGVALFQKYGYSKSLKRQLETTSESPDSLAMVKQALKDLL
ncbi:hypothetical protein [Xanthocytophaga agilis]|uniref:Uncharacterized protein n=1 Tax=Xanthocytophaga agilis TaxID=3048010 RepID=A0AAE3QZQ1_9BACT|nr:hypothetical protein [Xanthocytophaga agilis]MDJ1500465.1 hypothetical protein [Xanthocytophaga agilis]